MVARVEHTKYAVDPMTDTELETAAVKLGLHPDVLLEARVRAKLRMRAEQVVPSNKDAAKFRSLGRSELLRQGVLTNTQLMLCFAREPWVAWEAHVHAWGVDGAALLRSLIHAYLLGTYEPEQVNRYWLWDNRRLFVVRDGTCRVKVWVPWGARRALEVRARMRGASAMAILRALVMASMAGKFGRRGLLKIVDTRSMFDDEERYFLGGS